MTALPAALSVAPVPPCQLSRCAPIITTSCLLASALDLADDVHRIAAVVEEARLDVELQLHGNLVIEQTRDPVVVLGRQRHHRRWYRIFRVARAAGLREDGSALTRGRRRCARRLRRLRPREIDSARAGTADSPPAARSVWTGGADRCRAGRTLAPVLPSGRLGERREVRVGSAHRRAAEGSSADSRPVPRSSILPLSVPLYFAKSPSLLITTIVASPVTGRWCPAYRRAGTPMSGAYCGSIRCAEKRVNVQPRPNGPHFSWCALMPHSPSCFTTQSAALKKPGELVRRGTRHVGQIEQMLHHLRVLQRLLANPMDDVEIDRLLGDERCRDQQGDDRGRERTFPSQASLPEPGHISLPLSDHPAWMLRTRREDQRQDCGSRKPKSEASDFLTAVRVIARPGS